MHTYESGGLPYHRLRKVLAIQARRTAAPINQMEDGICVTGSNEEVAVVLTVPVDAALPWRLENVGGATNVNMKKMLATSPAAETVRAIWSPFI
jgi:hypothetical protein